MFRPKRKVLAAVRPNEGLAALYRRAIQKLIDEMHVQVRQQLLSSARRHTPLIHQLIAQDRTPASELQYIIKKLRHNWLLNFDSSALKMAEYFAKNAHERSISQLRFILRKSGLSIPVPKLTQTMEDVLAAVIHENVALIRSIPEQYFTQIEGSVMRAVAKGGDLAGLTAQLEKHYDVSWKRAALIARDQNSKANAVIDRTQRLQLGLSKAIWQHSHAGKEPRPSHVENNGKEFDLNTGWFDPDEGHYILPGELINCRCTSRAVIPGFI